MPGAFGRAAGRRAAARVCSRGSSAGQVRGNRSLSVGSSNLALPAAHQFTTPPPLPLPLPPLPVGPGCRLCCRQCVLPLVCRKWHDLAQGPELLRSISVQLPALPAEPLLAFLRWLAGPAAAAGVQQLSLTVTAAHEDQPSWGPAAQDNSPICPRGSQEEPRKKGHRALAAALHAALRACGAGGHLTALYLQLPAPLQLNAGDVACWVHSLRRLHIVCYPPDLFSAPTISAAGLEGLTCLEALLLEGTHVQLLPAAATGDLPPALTCLRLHGYRCPPASSGAALLPPQVGLGLAARGRVVGRRCSLARSLWVREQEGGWWVAHLPS